MIRVRIETARGEGAQLIFSREFERTIGDGRSQRSIRAVPRQLRGVQLSDAEDDCPMLRCSLIVDEDGEQSSARSMGRGVTSHRSD